MANASSVPYMPCHPAPSGCSPRAIGGPVSASPSPTTRVVFEVDLPDCEVVAGAPPRIYGRHLAIGQGSKFVARQF
jgi:hypothetical protein